MTTPASPRAELIELVNQALQADSPAEAIVALFWDVRDEWEEIDITTLGQYPGSDIMWNRYLVARIPRQGVHRRPDRTVSP